MFNKKRTKKTIALTVIGLLLIIVSSYFCLPAPGLLQGVGFSQVIYDSDHRVLRLTLTPDGQYRLYKPLSAIAPVMISSTLLKEDQSFYSHHGINLFAIADAFRQTYFQHHYRRGASTITMQVARLRYKLATHSVLGKMKQIIIALWLEHHYSKQGILTAYFNLAPYGNNIEGVGAASLIYYHQDAKDLTLPQALTLSVIPQNPSKRSLNTYKYSTLKDARHNLYNRYISERPQDKQYAGLIQLPLDNFTRRQLAFNAPHFVNEVLQNKPQSREIITSLNLKWQNSIEQIVRHYLSQKKSLGLQNACVMLIDTNDMSVKALIGSADFFNQKIAGQVDGTLAKRSPGSALKPFIYALAIDQGLIHPATVLKDAPMNFGGYDPENFDYDFLGPINAKDALILSRNIPAIYLANQLHQPTFYDFLVQSGMKLRAEKDYGLALVLGGAEISMQHLLSLYAMLVNQGVYYPLQRFPAEKPLNGKRLLSPEASFLVLDMLRANPRPSPVNLGYTTNKIPLAWKTGTSSSYRDAWAVGVFNHYALAVWIGDFSGKGNPAFTGRDAAAPLFFNIFDMLTNQKQLANPIPENLSLLHITKVEVCAASGMLPTHACPRKISTWFIPGKSPIQKDTVYREVMLNPQTGLRTCHFDPQNQFKVFEFWSSDLLRIFHQAGIAKDVPPPFEEDCQFADKIIRGAPPQITSPQASMHYAIVAKTSSQVQIALKANVDSDVETLHWFANAAYIGKVARDQVLWWVAKPGRYKVRVVDNFGRSDVVEIRVIRVSTN